MDGYAEPAPTSPDSKLQGIKVSVYLLEIMDNKTGTQVSARFIIFFLKKKIKKTITSVPS
jgi:hypothetical protein